MVACACHPNYVGTINRKIKVQIYLGKNARSYQKNN
jgi:hypothetical protein